jgi:preprotein translocase subunit Sec61beta
VKGTKKQVNLPVTSSGFLQFSINEELSGVKIEPKTAILIFAIIVLSIKIFNLLLQ